MDGIAMDGEIMDGETMDGETMVGVIMDGETMDGVIMVMHIIKVLEMEFMLQMETIITDQGITEEEKVEGLEQDYHPLMGIEGQIREQLIHQGLLKTQTLMQGDNLQEIQ